MRLPVGGAAAPSGSAGPGLEASRGPPGDILLVTYTHTHTHIQTMGMGSQHYSQRNGEEGPPGPRADTSSPETVPRTAGPRLHEIPPVSKRRPASGDSAAGRSLSFQGAAPRGVREARWQSGRAPGGRSAARLPRPLAAGVRGDGGPRAHRTPSTYYRTTSNTTRLAAGTPDQTFAEAAAAPAIGVSTGGAVAVGPRGGCQG